MVTVIKPSSSLRHTLNYNEQKVSEKVARFIHAVNYPKDMEKLTFTDKLNRLQKQAALHPRVTKNSIHINLNFDPSEKLSDEKYKAIAEKYMTGIGYEHQPYLVYEHLDSGHPHIHIVTTNVRADGTRIPSNNIGKIQSETIRKQIEKDFGLVIAQKQQRSEAHRLQPVIAGKVIYGKSPTKRAITSVLESVVKQYKFSSLQQLNAILELYNVRAERGSPDSRTYKNNGLLYRVINEKGESVGVPIKASDLYNKPTLKFLENKFTENDALKQKYKSRIKIAFELAFQHNRADSIEKLRDALQKDGISLVIRQNAQGVVYGLTYVSHDTKCVFNGSELGKAYSANAVMEKIGHTQSVSFNKPQEKLAKEFNNDRTSQVLVKSNSGVIDILKEGGNKILEELLQDEYAGTVAHELREDERKRKRKRLRH